MLNPAWNQAPETGALGMAPVGRLLFSGSPPKFGSHIWSKPLPVGLFAPLGISDLELSDSPGGLIHTNAKMPGAGFATGRAPMPPG